MFHESYFAAIFHFEPAEILFRNLADLENPSFAYAYLGEIEIIPGNTKRVAGLL